MSTAAQPRPTSTPTERVVLITGAGRGLGRAIAEAFRRHGYSVVASDLDSDSLADLQNVDGYVTVQTDVTDAASVQRLAQRIRSDCGRLDVIVNNAGVIGYSPVVETDPDELIAHFQVNSFGALRVTHGCLDLLAESRGRVINVTSEAFRLRNPFQIYAVTKLTLEGLSDVMRRELTWLGIHVATVRPGAIDTDLFHSVATITNPVPDGRLAAPFAKFAERLEKHPPRRVSAPADVARLVFKAATDKRARAHYEINNMAAIKLASKLPTSWADAAMRRMLG